GVTAITRPFGLLACALVLSLLGGGRLLAAESYPFEMKLSNNVLGDNVFKGEITPTNGRFEQIVSSGGLRVRLSGSIAEDRVSVTGELLFSGNWRFFPFSTNGAFSSAGTFTGSVVAQRSNGQSARGSISITRPAAVAEALPKPEVQTAQSTDPKGDSAAAGQSQNQIQPEVDATGQQQVAVVVPPEPEEPALTREQRAAVQQQLSVLGLYGSAIDGNLGLGTRKAIRRFQRLNKLEPTGYLTDATLARLEKRS